VQLLIGNHVRVVAVPVSGNIDRKNNLSHRPPITEYGKQLQRKICRSAAKAINSSIALPYKSMKKGYRIIGILAYDC
jgi:hypothetical protein